MVFWDLSPFFFILPTHSNSEFKQRSGGVEAHFLKLAMKKRAGFKLSDFSQCLRCGVSVLHGLFFLWVWRRCWEVCPRCNLETRAQNKPPFPVPHEFSVISQIKFNFVLKKKVKVFDKIPHCPAVLSHIISSDHFPKCAWFQHSTLRCTQVHTPAPVALLWPGVSSTGPHLNVWS